ncbi:MAG TPA: tyrosine-type recombinase/integrase [Chloroflexota bacterium]|nr:tyrosine-type recombinase/integrase [Chloroflexota bacterium]
MRTFAETADDSFPLDVLPALVPVGSLLDPTQAYLGSLAPKSQRVVQERLRAVAKLIGAAVEDVPWHALRVHHLEYIRARLLEQDAAPATVNLTLAALRGIARYSRRFGLITVEEFESLQAVRPARGERLPAGRSISTAELVALVQACRRDATPAGLRDAAILAVLYTGGVRRAELAALELADYTPEPPTLRIRHGKGNKERLVPLIPSASAALVAWITWRGAVPGSLFLPLSKAGRPSGPSFSSYAVYKMLTKRGLQAGVTDISPHDFRRTFVGDLLDAGIDLSTVQQLAGHANVTTTARYDRRGEATKRRAVEALHFPT